MTKLLNAASRGGGGPTETTVKLTDLSDSDTVFDLISVLFAYVILGQKIALISEPLLFFYL